jgi:hypothetical protein
MSRYDIPIQCSLTFEKRNIALHCSDCGTSQSPCLHGVLLILSDRSFVWQIVLYSPKIAIRGQQADLVHALSAGRD